MSTDLNFLGDKVSVVIGDDLIPKCTIKKYTANVFEEKLPIGLSAEEMKEYTRKKTERVLKKRAEDFTNGVDLFKDFRYIDIDKLQKTVNGWNYFDKPGTYELLNLISSVESIGIITPLIVKTSDNETFTIINGNSRYLALVNICKYKDDERFRKIPCFVVDDDIDEYYERSLMIDSNINYRKVSQEVYIKSILEKYSMLRQIKTYRGELNIAETIANQMSISDATVFNYLTLQKLCPDAMALLYEKKLKLQPARMLAKLSHENQMYILETAKLEDINAIHKLQVLTRNENAKKDEVEKKTDFIKNFLPQNTNVTITVNIEALKDLFSNIIGFKEFIHTKFSQTKADKYVKRLIKVNVNKEHMKFYFDGKFLDGSIIEKITGKSLNEILAV